MKRLLVTSFDMEVGGVERSLVNMLEKFNYNKYSLDLMLYRHKGEFMNLLCDKVNLLDEVKEYSTYRMSINEMIKDKKIKLALTRLMAKYTANFLGKARGYKETGSYQMQLMWKYGIRFLPDFDTTYDVAISYLWPHYFVAEKVLAKQKVAWIHTDFKALDTDRKMDLKVWDKFDNIVAVSTECKKSFLDKYPELKDKVVVIENITSPEFIHKMAREEITGVTFDKHCFNLLTVARLSHAKGVDNAVKALKLLHEKGLKKIKWYVVGYGGDKSKIRELIIKNNLQNSFILLGKKINPYPYMRMCDMYVQPSRYEGKAVTVIEAQILGKPVIITNYETASSQVKSRYDGYITDLSIEGLADGIQRVYIDDKLRKRLSENCKKTDYSNSFELEKLYKLFG